LLSPFWEPFALRQANDAVAVTSAASAGTTGAINKSAVAIRRVFLKVMIYLRS
jgi:hypothetical protein